MKIKHYAGYGTVNATKIKDGSCSLHVRVTGNHECGIHRYAWDTYLIYNWLVKRFDKSFPDAYAFEKSLEDINIIDGYYFDENNRYVDQCDYLFTYKKVV